MAKQITTSYSNHLILPLLQRTMDRIVLQVSTTRALSQRRPRITWSREGLYPRLPPAKSSMEISIFRITQHSSFSLLVFSKENQIRLEQMLPMLLLSLLNSKTIREWGKLLNLLIQITFAFFNSNSSPLSYSTNNNSNSNYKQYNNKNLRRGLI